jgi:two-component system sensor histidine kinase TctE
MMDNVQQAQTDAAGQGEQYSLFIEILDWMLLPLLFVWPVSIVVTYIFASNISNVPYDRELNDSVNAIAQLVKVADRRVSVRLPGEARAILRADEFDTIYFQILGPRGDVLAGDAQMPRPAAGENPLPQMVYYRDETFRDTEIRVAAMFLQFPELPGEGRVWIQVGETLEKRHRLSNDIVAGMLLPQFFLIPLAAALVWFGLMRGLAPLSRLELRIRDRRSSDLSPIDEQQAPEELRALIRSINGLMARVKQNLSAQERFVADAAHQMRTPLAGLKTQTELALRQGDAEQVQHALKQIATSTDRATHLINQLLTLARTEGQDAARAALKKTSLNEAVREAVRDWVPIALERKIDLGFEGPEQSVIIEANPLLLRELVANLIDNAIRYNRPGGYVTARIRAAEFAILEIEDNGIGIEPDERDLVFERFYRTLGSGVDGSGLGLSIVREIAKLHQANVLVRPNPAGQGTIVSVVFPRV